MQTESHRVVVSGADLVHSSFDIGGFSGRRFSDERAVSVFTRRHAVHAFEVSDEMTFISATDASDDLFNAEKSGGEKGGRMLHA